MDNAIGVAQLATLLTAAGVAIYVLGLVGLALSINLTFTEHWSTAWYAVSLMPRTVVAGQGVRIWRRGWIRIVSVVVVSTALPVINYYLGAFLENAPGRCLKSCEIIRFGLIVVTILIFTPVSSRILELYRAGDLKADDNAPQYRRLSWVTAASLWTIGIGISISGIYLASKGLRLNSADDPANWAMITVAFLIFLVGAFFLAIPAAADRAESPLPMITLIEAGELGEAAPKTVGWLVAHSDGYWHLFDSRHVLLSIPDERVTEARVDDLGISEQLEATSNSTEQLRQAPPQKSSNEDRDADRGED